jgi:hypothetical protein
MIDPVIDLLEGQPGLFGDRGRDYEPGRTQRFRVEEHSRVRKDHHAHPVPCHTLSLVLAR